MDLMDLLILLLLVLPTPVLAVSREFLLINLSKNWTEAQSYCRDKFSDLATIENADDWEIVSDIVAKSGHTYVWLGMYDDAESWRWSMDNTSLYERDFGNVFEFFQNNENSNQHCAGVLDGTLNDYNCEDEFQSVCYDETSNSYIPVTDLKTWQSAQSYCRQTYTDLASLRNQQEWDNVMGVVVSGSVYWSGLSREGWKWSDRSDSSFRKWNSRQPNGHGEGCGGTYSTGFFDWHCRIQLPFICSVPQRKVVKVMIKTAGSVNPNDPLVQETVMKQMENDLREQGVHQEFSLRWRKQPHGDVFNKTEPEMLSDNTASA